MSVITPSHRVAVAGRRARPSVRSGYRLKRPVDLVVGLVLALATLPIVVVCAAVSAVRFGAWPFFVQYREGMHGVPFRFVKIRSMSKRAPKYADREQLGEVAIGRWGNFIRNRHLDELPQFWQVVFGSMSLVGPRPMITSICERMDEDFRAVRHAVRPGVTGLWQVSEAGTRLVLEATHYDERYVEWASPSLDAWIVWKTVGQVLGGRQMTEDEVLDRVSLGSHFGPVRKRLGVQFHTLIDETPIVMLRPEHDS